MFQGQMQSRTAQTFKHDLGYHLTVSITQDNMQYFLTGKLFKPEKEFGKKEKILGLINIKLGDWYAQEEIDHLSKNIFDEANQAVLRLEARYKKAQQMRFQNSRRRTR